MNGCTKGAAWLSILAGLIFILAIALAELDDMQVSSVAAADFYDDYEIYGIFAGAIALIAGFVGVYGGVRENRGFISAANFFVACLGALILATAYGTIEMGDKVEFFVRMILIVATVVALAYFAYYKRWVASIIFILMVVASVAFLGNDFNGDHMDIFGYKFPLFAFDSDLMLLGFSALYMVFIGIFTLIFERTLTSVAFATEDQGQAEAEEAVAVEAAAPAASAEDIASKAAEEKEAKQKAVIADAVKANEDAAAQRAAAVKAAEEAGSKYFVIDLGEEEYKTFAANKRAAGIATLEKELFSVGITPKKGAAACEGISIVKCGTPYAEAEAAASHVRTLLQEFGTKAEGLRPRFTLELMHIEVEFPFALSLYPIDNHPYGEFIE